MNNISDHAEYYELILSTEVLLNILDAIDSKSAINETEVFNKLNRVYKMSVTSFRELSEGLDGVNDDNIEHLAQALPDSLREGIDYLGANYRDGLRPKLISVYDYLTEFSDYATDLKKISRNREAIEQIINDFAHLPDIDESNLPKSLRDLRKPIGKEVVFRFSFDHNTDILAVNGITIRRLTTTSSYNEPLTEAMNNPGKPVRSSSKMTKFISELNLPNTLKDLFFPVRGKARFMIIPEITREMLDRKDLDIEILKRELLKLKNNN